MPELVNEDAVPDEVVPDEVVLDVPDAFVPGVVARGDVASDSAVIPEDGDEVAGAAALADPEDEAVATACAADANANNAGVSSRGSRDGLRMAVLLRSFRVSIGGPAMRLPTPMRRSDSARVREGRPRRERPQSSNSAGQSSSCSPGASSSLDQRACRHGSKSETGMPSSSISRRGGSFALRGSILAFGFMAALSSPVNLHRI
jgi:hypothetical protein